MLTMADGPVANLQAYGGHLDAVAGYVNVSGIGATYLPMCQAFPDLHHLSITTSADPLYAKAQVGDCEAGALSVEQALAHPVFYGSWATVNTLTSRPPKLWVAHVNPQLGQHVCGASVCGCKWEADGTQWAQNIAPGIDLSILANDFFVGLEPPPPKEDPDLATAAPFIAYATEDATSPPGVKGNGQYFCWAGRASLIGRPSDTQTLLPRCDQTGSDATGFVPLAGNVIAQMLG